ncbi:hypothetical protein QBC39DRAFT_158151 [Podospora conica]|nr:hypothetical protein QBC39DRAFT_158151 [Schizothecium conicum]
MPPSRPRGSNNGKGAANRLLFVPRSRGSFLAPCLDSARGGANSGTILPGGSSGFVVDSRGRAGRLGPGATGSRQAAPVSSLRAASASVARIFPRPLPLPKILQGSRILDSENRPLSTESCQAVLDDVRAHSLACPVFHLTRKMCCGAAAEVQRERERDKVLLCNAGGTHTPLIPPVERRVLRCTATSNLGSAPLGCQMSPPSSTLSTGCPNSLRMMSITSARASKTTRENGSKFPCAHHRHRFGCQPRDMTLGRPYGDGTLVGRGPKGLLMSSIAAQELLLTGTLRRSRRRRWGDGASGIFWPGLASVHSTLSLLFANTVRQKILIWNIVARLFRRRLRLRQAGGEDKSRQGASWSPSIAAISSGPESS